MCNRFRTVSREWKAGQELELEEAGGTFYRGKWAGSATVERLRTYWLGRRFPDSLLLQTVEIVTEISEVAKDTGEIIWGPAPHGCRLLFVLEASPSGKSYRLAKLVTTAATDAQLAYFRYDRFPLTGRLRPDGEIEVIPPADLPEQPPRIVKPPKPQGELF